MLNTREIALLSRYQRGFPLCPRPFAVIAEQEGMQESEVLALFKRLAASGVLSRVGGVVDPGTVGVSTLAAMNVPEARLEEVAHMVSSLEHVNHNYQREHAYNLWFVLHACDQQALQGILEDLERATGLEVLVLPMLEAFHLDTGFALS